jgi:hypothetical protein
MRGCKRAPQSSQKTRWSALALPHVEQSTAAHYTKMDRAFR